MYSYFGSKCFTRNDFVKQRKTTHISAKISLRNQLLFINKNGFNVFYIFCVKNRYIDSSTVKKVLKSRIKKGFGGPKFESIKLKKIYFFPIVMKLIVKGYIGYSQNTIIIKQVFSTIIGFII